MGVVYFVQSVLGGPVKIGFAVNANARVHALQLGSPIRLRLLAVEPGGRVDEHRLHKRFAVLALGREWFRPEPDLIDYIKTLGGAPSDVPFATIARAGPMGAAALDALRRQLHYSKRTLAAGLKYYALAARMVGRMRCAEVTHELVCAWLSGQIPSPEHQELIRLWSTDDRGVDRLPLALWAVPPTP
jgi:hypothetical protein